MRVNPDMSNDVLAAIWETQSQENTALQQMSTGKRVNVPSDDPLAAAQMVGNQAQTSRSDQYLQNIDTLTSQLQTADTALGSAVTAVDSGHNPGRAGLDRNLVRRKPSADRAKSSGDSKSAGAIGQYVGGWQLFVRRHRDHDPSLRSRFHQPVGRHLQRQHRNQHSADCGWPESANQYAGQPAVPEFGGRCLRLAAKADHLFADWHHIQRRKRDQRPAHARSTR